MVPYKKYQIREELHHNCDLPKKPAKGEMKHRLLRGGKHETTGQSLEGFIKDWSLVSGCTFQQCRKATASATESSGPSFGKMGGREGFGTDE